MLRDTVMSKVLLFSTTFLVVTAPLLAGAGHDTAKREPRVANSTAGLGLCAAHAGTDFDLDCDVDLDDYRVFQVCVTGANAGPPGAGCAAMDRDGDGDVDVADGAFFVPCQSPPGFDADPACEESGFEPPTSLDKIDEELAAGKITELDALRYKVFSVVGDSRMPSRFGGATYEEGTFVMDQLAAQYGDLSPEAQSELLPFLLPPDAPGSWYAAFLPESSVAGVHPAGLFSELDVTDGSGMSVAVVKWPADEPLQSSAETVRDALGGADGVYEKLVSLMGRAPVSDGNLGAGLNGGDGRYDVYLLPAGSSNFGWTQPHSPGFFQGVFNDATRSSYIVIDVQSIASRFTGAAYDRKLRSNLAHEFMHVIQYAFDLNGSRSDYWWLGDATATWAEDYVFPADDMEHSDAPAYLRTLDVPVEVDSGNRRYGGYLYFFHHVAKYSADILRFTYESAEIGGTLAAIDAAVPGGIAENWAEFAVANWNDPPVDDYETADGLREGAGDYITARQPQFGTSTQGFVQMALTGSGLEPLSAQYFHFVLSDPDIRSILFANGLTFNLKRGVPPLFVGGVGDETLYATRLNTSERERLHVMALVKQNGVWSPEPFDFTDVAFAPFCQEAASESVEELVIIMANARFEDNEREPVTPVGLTTRLFMSNMGCGAWEGTGQHVYSVSQPDETTTSTANFQTLKFTRNTLSLDQIAIGAGQQAFGPTGGSDIIPIGSVSFNPLGGSYQLVDLSGGWTHSSTYEFGDTRCSESGFGTFELADSQIFSPLFNTAPFLRASLGNALPSMFRSFLISMGFVDGDENFFGSCVDGQGNVTAIDSPFGASISGGWRNGEFGSLTVSQSGDQINQTWTVDDDTFQLNLQSANIP